MIPKIVRSYGNSSSGVCHRSFQLIHYTYLHYRKKIVTEEIRAPGFADCADLLISQMPQHDDLTTNRQRLDRTLQSAGNIPNLAHCNHMMCATSSHRDRRRFQVEGSRACHRFPHGSFVIFTCIQQETDYCRHGTRCLVPIHLCMYREPTHCARSTEQ